MRKHPHTRNCDEVRCIFKALFGSIVFFLVVVFLGTALQLLVPDVNNMVNQTDSCTADCMLMYGSDKQQCLQQCHELFIANKITENQIKLRKSGILIPNQWIME